MPTPRRPTRALLILDMISEYEFEDWRRIVRAARPIAPRIARLAVRAREARIPVMYVNDTGKNWESDQSAFLARCLAPQARGRDIAALLRPRAGDFFIFKPRHSAFYATPLAELLEQSGVQELILTGITSHQCVLFTAMDAHVRGLTLTVPGDTLGAGAAVQTRMALAVLREALGARVMGSARLRLSR